MRVEVCVTCGRRWAPSAFGNCPHCLQEWVEESCAAQGFPVKVTDPEVLERVAVLLT